MLLCASVLGVGACSGGGSTAKSISRRSAKPNIVFVLADDLDRGEIAYLPSVRKLIAERGMTLQNQLVNDSLCCPSRTTMLRGQYAHNSGVIANSGPDGGFPSAFRRGIVDDTVGTWLQRAGYSTALYGKFLNGYPNPASNTYEPAGWTDWAGAIDSPNAYGEFNYDVIHNRQRIHYGTAASDYGTDVYTNYAVDFARRNIATGTPFFAYVSYFAPHQPATPAPRDTSLFLNGVAPRTPAFNEADVSDKPSWLRSLPLLSQSVIDRVDSLYRERLRSLQAVDRGVRKLVDTLRQANVLDNTYFVFTSDNGFHLGEHRLAAGKRTPYESDIRVPFMVRGPGIVAGSSTSVLTGNVDLAETFAAIANASTPSFEDGRSLLDLWHQRPSAAMSRSGYVLEHIPEPAVFASSDNDINAKTTSVLGSAEPANIPQYTAVRTATKLYVEYVNGEREYYDLVTDPNELSNRASTMTIARRSAWSTYLHAMVNCAADTCRTADATPEPT